MAEEEEEDEYADENLWNNENNDALYRSTKKHLPIIVKCGELLIGCEHPEKCSIFENEIKNKVSEVELLYDEDAVRVAMEFVNTGFLNLDKDKDIREVCRVAFEMGIPLLENALAEPLANIVRNMDKQELEAFLQLDNYNKQDLCEENLYIYMQQEYS